MNDEDPRHDAFCTECGERLDADAPFCGACGEPVAAADGGPGWTLPKSGMFALGALGFAVVLVGVGLLVPSVGGSSDRVSVEIAGAEGGRVTLGEDIEVVLPAGALSGDAVLSVLRGASERVPEGQVPGARPVGDAFEITVEGATLTGTAILTFGLDRQLADDLDAVFVTYFDEDSEEWRPVAAVVDAASGMVRAEVEHLSLWRPATWDVDAIADGLGESYDRLFGLADPPPPECKPDPADGIEVVYRGVYACVKGGAGEPLVVRITNPRTFAIEIQAPPGTPQATVSASSSLSDELLQRVLERLGPDVVYVLPGATAEFVMEFDPAPGSELRWAVRGSEDAALASAVLFMLETAESMLDSTQLSGFRDCLETVAPQGLTEASFLTTMGGCGPALISNLGEAQGGFVVGLIRGTTQALQGLVERGVGDLLRGYEFTGSAVVTIEATGEEHRSEQHLEMIGGTWNRFDVPELLGTAFMWDPQHGIMDSVHVHGPEGWNERTDDTWTCPLYQPPGISPNRSICFTHASPAIPGLLTATQRYHAQAEVGTKAVEATFGFFVGDQLDHVIDMSVTDVSLTEVAVEWTAPPGAGSFLVRINLAEHQDMGERYVEGEIVLSGEARSGTIGDLDLSPGAMYQVSVFAFSYDITTDDPLVGPFNVSEDHMFAQPELPEEEVGQPDVYEFNDRVAWFEELTSNDMVLTGAWWALADWCTSTGTAEKGRCYDLAAEYLLDSFAIDVRTVTAEDWAGQGAVGAVIDDGYMITRRYLANGPEALDPSGRWEDRPPLDWRCDPDCTSAAN